MKILLIGGGTAGWLSAIYLQKYIPEAEITVIASKEIGIIGVGEATLPNFSDFLHQVDLDEQEFMRETNATYKIGIQFSDWSAKMEKFNVGFQLGLTEKNYSGLPFSYYWASAFQKYNYGIINDPSSHLIKENKVPFTNNGNPSHSPYAYHFDAVKVGIYLKKIALNRGVKFVEATIQEVLLHEDNSIQALLIDDSTTLSADLYVDCSGFRSLLLEASGKNDFVPYSKELLCDTAVVTRTYYESIDTPIPSFTESFGMNAGWRWRIPLFDKIGNGYVYSSQYIDYESAKSEFLDAIGLPQETECNLVKMKIGRHTESWYTNVVAIGGAYGFIEPLESTGLYLVCKQLELFASHHSKQDRKGYNTIVAKYYDDIKNFIVFHYYSSQKEETPFWRFYREKKHFSESFLQILDFLEKKLPDDSFDSTLNFPKELPGKYAYTRIAIGQGFFPNTFDMKFDSNSLEAIEKDISTNYKRNKKVREMSREHREYLTNTVYEKN